MKKEEELKFSWCPVCMVHTYHKKEHGKWRCTDWNHKDFLRFRTDPWIEEYRKSQSALPLPVHKGA
jgi:hypothetical protein